MDNPHFDPESYGVDDEIFSIEARGEDFKTYHDEIVAAWMRGFEWGYPFEVESPMDQFGSGCFDLGFRVAFAAVESALGIKPGVLKCAVGEAGLGCARLSLRQLEELRAVPPCPSVVNDGDYALQDVASSMIARIIEGDHWPVNCVSLYQAGNHYGYYDY